MFSLLAQTTQPAFNWSIESITALIVALTAFVGVLKNWWDIQHGKQADKNLADAMKDGITDNTGAPLPNVSPSTLPTLENISKGGTGDGTAK